MGYLLIFMTLTDVRGQKCPVPDTTVSGYNRVHLLSFTAMLGTR
jgi:hypothetical protein